MFKKTNLSPTDHTNLSPFSAPYNSTAPTFNSSTPNSRLVPGPPTGISNTMTPGYHAVSGEYQNQYNKQYRDPSYRESDASVYSTYDLRESLVDPTNERVVGISRETYIEPQTSTLVHTQVTPQSIYGAQYLNPQDASRTSLANTSKPPSMAHMSFFNDESSDSLHSDIRNLRPESTIKHQPRMQQAESPVRMQHAYVDVPLPSAAVIEQISVDNTASVYMDSNRASNVSGYNFDTPSPNSAHAQTAITEQNRSLKPITLSTASAYTNTHNNNVDSYYHNANTNSNFYNTSSQQQHSSSRQHPQPLAPLVIPPTPSRSMTPPTQQQQQEQNALASQQGYYQPSPVQQNAPIPVSSSSSPPPQQQNAYYQPHLYSNTGNRSQDDGLQQPQLTPGTQSGGSPHSVSPRTPSPNTLLPPQQPYANHHNGSSSSSPSSPSPTSPLQYQQPPLSPCLPPPSAHPGLSEKLQNHIRNSLDMSSKAQPQSEGEGLVAEGIRYHETGRLDMATDCFRQAANKESPIGMYLYALSLRHGWGCKRNERTAFQFLQKTAEHAISDIQEYISGRGSKLVAHRELAMAIFELGQTYYHGWGCKRDKKTGAYYYKIAADLGEADAQNEIGRCYQEGKGVKKNMKLAAKYYRKADEQGHGMMGNSWIYKSKYDDPPAS
ncbi:hypothetical protein BDA99DRAFT_349660 [Phascolomyces articulosus]|uniref:HCP-like protein n=1 Tax=Phascolomyces articulosus TaxID=60185 RepID=A0AAD5PFN2_9FUNG|nr:hypothetical protein BDA99DRAFT_349660 [Phascolomyces articulosus]